MKTNFISPYFSQPCFDIYVLDTREASCLDYLNFLSPEEIKKFSELKFEAVKKSKIISQGFKRRILGQVLNQSPKDLIFKLSPEGKPYLDLDLDLDVKKIFFNISHAGDFVVLGISRFYELGVDIEKVKKLDYLSLARRFFHELEIKILEKESDLKIQENLFFKLWNYKEAFLKAIGLGIAYGLDQFAMDPRSGVFLEQPKEIIYKNYYAEALDLNFNLNAETYFAAVCWRPGEDSNLRPTP